MQSFSLLPYHVKIVQLDTPSNRVQALFLQKLVETLTDPITGTLLRLSAIPQELFVQ